jgi:hypothetical protein
LGEKERDSCHVLFFVSEVTSYPRMSFSVVFAYICAYSIPIFVLLGLGAMYELGWWVLTKIADYDQNSDGNSDGKNKL